MKIIGHRGAAGLALENTIESIRIAVKTGVDAVEIDIRLTKDEQIILSHDAATGRVSPTDKHIDSTSFETLRALKLHNGSQLPTLQEALHATGKTSLIIDAKGDHWARPLAAFLKENPSKTVSVIAFNHDELSRFHVLCPEVPVYALDRWSPFDVTQIAHEKKFTGIDLNFWVLNPLTYWLARRAGLKIIVYTVNHVWIARFLKALYPDIGITTNHPDKMQILRK